MLTINRIVKPKYEPILSVEKYEEECPGCGCKFTTTDEFIWKNNGIPRCPICTTKVTFGLSDGDIDRIFNKFTIDKIMHDRTNLFYSFIADDLCRRKGYEFQSRFEIVGDRYLFQSRFELEIGNHMYEFVVPMDATKFVMRDPNPVVNSFDNCDTIIFTDPLRIEDFTIWKKQLEDSDFDYLVFREKLSHE